MSASEHDTPWSILERGTGEWVGAETMAPAPWAPEGLEAVGRSTARLILDGRGLAADYVQEVDGKATMHGHGVTRWDESAGDFVMHFHTQPGGPPSELRGKADGDTLVLEGPGPGGRMRQTVVYGTDRMDVRAESLDPDADRWSTTFEAVYRRPPHEAETAPGGVAWVDLTVDDADGVRDFYMAVTGWTPHEVSMGDYADYAMLDGNGQPVAGVCHARGSNADLPATWLVYVTVKDLDTSVATVEERGGRVVVAPRPMGADRMAVVSDPAGGVLALYQKA
ncbi:MAG: VOC family protein [Longimicrobiales bacterium]